MAQHRTRQSEWPPMQRQRSGSVLAPGIREQTDRDFCGPLRPGIAGTVGARGGAVADDSRQSDLGMDHMFRDTDPIGETKRGIGPIDLISDRGGRRTRSE